VWVVNVVDLGKIHFFVSILVICWLLLVAVGCYWLLVLVVIDLGVMMVV
jgi:hypothetical protein